MEKLEEESVGPRLLVLIMPSLEYNSNDRRKEPILSILVEVQINNVHLKVEIVTIEGVLWSIIPSALILSFTFVETEQSRCEFDRSNLWEPPLRQGCFEM